MRFSRHVQLITRCATTWTLDMPRWGTPIAHGVVGTVGEVLCNVGAHVESDEVVVIIETDKVSVDIRARRNGVVDAVLVDAGDEVSEGQPLYRFIERAEASSTGEDDWSVRRGWASEFSHTRERQAEEAALRFAQWQRRWQREQADRWKEWQRERQQAWWRGQQHHSNQWQQQQQRQRQRQRQGQGQGQQHGSRQHRPPSPPPSASPADPAWRELPPGAVRRLLLAETHYEALGVPRTASAADIRQAFQRLAHQVHPDKFHAECGSALALAAPDAFLRLQQAHWILSSPNRRREYDRPGW